MKTNSNQFGHKVNIDKQLSEIVQDRIFTLLNRKGGSWQGTMTELSRAITTGIKKSVPANWPTNPSIVRRVVNTIAYSLRKEGVSVKFGRSTDHMRTRFVSFEQN